MARTTLSGLKPGSSVTVQVLAVTEMNSAEEDNDGPSSQGTVVIYSYTAQSISYIYSSCLYSVHIRHSVTLKAL